MKISIFGLGYVGAVSMACLARDGHDVIGVDIDETKLELIRDGKSPIIESGIVELMRSVVESGKIQVTDDASEAIQGSEMSFVCVGTPSLPNGDQNLDALRRLAEQIGIALKDKDAGHTVVIRSTVQPGTVEEVVIPRLEQHSGKTVGRDIFVCFQPEFLREGSSIKDYDNPPMTVIGASDGGGVEQLRSVFGDLPCEFLVTDIRTAESLKYACNAFHALKVTFANEMGRICQALGSDSHRVMQLLCEDHQLNISRAYLRPGFAFGGSCLPKDLKALLYLAKSSDVNVPMLSSMLGSNRVHVQHAVDTVLQQGNRSIGIIGLSFKSGTDDLRESPMVELVERLIGKGMDLKIYDPEVRISRLMGANKRYIDDVIPHIGSLMADTLEETLRDAATVVVGLHGEDIESALVQFGRDDQYLLDLVGMDCRDSFKGTYQGICW